MALGLWVQSIVAKHAGKWLKLWQDECDDACPHPRERNGTGQQAGHTIRQLDSSQSSQIPPHKDSTTSPKQLHRLGLGSNTGGRQ